MGSATNELQFKVMLGLDSAVSQAEQLKKILSDSVKPNTNDYKSISSSIDQITKSAEKLRDKMKDAFKTSSGTKSFFKEYEKLSDLLETVQGKFGNVKFDNMLFSKEDVGSIKAITKEMDTLESSISAIKKGKISDLFDSGTGVAFDKIRESITELGGDVSKISFDALVKNLTASSDGATDRLNNLLSKIKEIDTLTENLDGSKSSKLVDALKESGKGTTETKLIDPVEIAQAKQRLLEYYELLNNKGVETEKQSTVRKGTSSADFIEKETERIEEAYEAQRLRAQSAKDKIDDILFNASKKKYEEGRGSTLSNKEKENIINNSEVQNALSLIGKSLSDYDNLPIKEKFQQIKTDLADGLNNLLDQSLIDQNKQEITDKLYSIFDGLGEPTVAKGKVQEFKNNIQTTLGSFNLNLKELGLDKMDITAGTKVADVYSTIINSLEAYIGKQKEAKQEIQDSGKIEEATNAANAYKQALEEVNNVKSDRNNSIENKTESLEELRGKILDIVNAWGQMTGVNINNILNPSALKEGSSAMTNYINSLSKLENHQKALSNVKTAVTRWMGFYQVLNLTKRAIKSMSNHITELDSVMTKIAVVTKMSQDDLWGQIGQYSEIARQYGVAIKGVYEVSQLYYQQGLEKGDVMNLTQETLKMARIAGIDYAQAADYMTTAIRGFKLEMSDAGHVTDVFSNLAAHTASSTEELAVAISKTASSAESVNSSFEATSAMMATMISTTRESATNIGSALKSIISRYGELKENKTGIDAEGEEYNLNKVDKALQSVGISIHDANGQFRDFDDVILELGESWDSIDKNAQRYIATIMAGNRQQSRFLSLVGNVEEYKRALSLAENADESGDIQVSKTMESIETKVERMKVTIQEFYTSSGIQDLYKGVLDTITNVISSANNLPKALGNLPVTALAVGAQIIGAIKNLAQFAIASLQNGIERIKISGKNAFEGMIPEAGRTGLKAGEAFKINFQNQMNSMQGSNKSFLGKVFSTDAGKLIGMGASTLLSAGGAALSLSAMNKYGASKSTAEDQVASGTMWGAAGLQGLSGFISGTIMSSNPIVGVFSGLASALPSLISAISMNNNNLERQLELSTKNLNEAKQKESVAKGNERDLESARDKLQELEEASYKSTEAMDEYKEYMNSLADTYPELVSSISETGDAIIELSSLENALTVARLESIDATSEALNKQIENNKLQKENYEHLANFGTSGYTPDNLFKILVGGNRTLASGYDSTQKANALTVVQAYNDWARQGNGTVFELDYSLDGKTLKDPGQAWNILFNKANEGSFAAFYDAQMQQIEDIASTMSGDKAQEYLHSFNQDYNQRKERYIQALKEFKEAADKTEKGAPSYSTLTGQKIEDLEEIKDWDEDTLLEAIENTKKIANDYIDSYNLSIDNLDTLLSNTKLNKELQLKINSSKKESNKDYNKYKSFMASMVSRRYGENIDWSNSANAKILEQNYDYWTNWIDNNEKQADYLMNTFDAKQFTNENEVKNALKEYGGLDEAQAEHKDIIDSYVKDNIEAVEASRSRANTAIERAFKYEDNKHLFADIKEVKSELGLYSSDDNKFIPQILDNFATDMDTFTSLRKSGYTIAAENYKNNLVSLYSLIGEELTGSQQSSILPTLQDLDLQDTTSLDNAIEALTGKEGMSGLVDVLTSIRNGMVTNVVTQAQLYADKAKDIAKETDNIFGNIGKAQSYSSVVESAQKLLNNTKNKDLKFDDLITYDKEIGSYVLSNVAVQESLAQSQADFTEKIDTLKQNAVKEKTFIENLDTSNLDDLENVALTPEEIEQLGIDPQDTKLLEAWAAKKQQLLKDASNAENLDQWKTDQISTIDSVLDNDIALVESIQKNSALNAIASMDFTSIVQGKNLTTSKEKFKTYLEYYNKDLVNKTDELWNLLLQANYDEFEVQTGIALSSSIKKEGKKERAQTLLTALDELSDDTISDYSEGTESIAKENNIDNISRASSEKIEWLKNKIDSELEAMLTDSNLAVSDYNDVVSEMGSRAERKAGRGKLKAVMDMAKDGITSDELNTYVNNWAEANTRLEQFINQKGELTNDYLKEIYEADEINGGFKLKQGLDTDFVIQKLGEAYGVTITKGSKEYNKLAAELFNQQVSDIDSEIADRATLNTGKQIVNQLKTLSSAEVGQEVNISTLTDDMKAALGIDAAETTMTIASELQRDNLMLLLESSIENYEEEGKEALQAVYNSIAKGIRSKRNVATGTQGILSKYVSQDAAEQFVESIGGSVDTAADVMTARGYIFNKYTQQWQATDKVLENKAKDLARAGDDPEARKQVELFYNQLEYSLKENPAQQALNNLLSGYTNLTDDTLATFESEFGINPADMAKYYTEDAAGVRKLDVQKLKADFADKFEEVLGPNWEQIFDNTLSQLSDQYIEAATKAGSLASQGTTSVSEMQTFTDSYNEKVAGANKTAEELFNYNDILDAWILDPEALHPYVTAQANALKEQGILNDETAQEWIKKRTNEMMAANVDIDSFLKAEDKSESGEAYKKLSEQMRLYYQEIGMADTEIDSYIQDRIKNLTTGGTEAVKEVQQWAKNRGKEATSEEIEEAYSNAINDLDTAMNKLSDLSIGQITTGKLKDYLTAAGKVDVDGVVTDISNMLDVYTQIYTDMKTTAGHTTAGLNRAYAKVLTEAERGDIDAIEAMGDAMGMTYDALGQILGREGTSLESWLATNKDIYENIGAGKIRITDFTRFAAQRGWEPSSEEYTSAFKTYNDGLIEQNKKAKETVTNELDAFKDIKPGDWLNVTEFENTFKKQAKESKKLLKEERKAHKMSQSEYENSLAAIDQPFKDLQTALAQFDGYIENGILKTTEDADMLNIAKVLSNAAVNMGEGMTAQLTDMVQSIMTSYTEAITKGIEGGMSNVEAEDLTKKARALGVDLTQPGNFITNANGLQLSSGASIALYNAMLQTDAIQAQQIYSSITKTLKDNNKYYKSSNTLLGHIGNTQEKIKNITDDTIESHKELKKQLEAERDIAKQIAFDDYAGNQGDWNFSDDGNISDSFNNILDYYSAWSSYQAQMESWKTSGQVNTSSFVDLLAHVSQVAQKTGKDIQFLGQTFDKSGLINGMTLDNLQSTLVSAVRSDKKGNTFLDAKILSQLGWNMQAGAKAIADIYGDLDAYWQPTFEQAEEWNKFADSMNAVERAMNKAGKTTGDFFDTDADGNSIFNPKKFNDFIDSTDGLRETWDSFANSFKIDGTKLSEIVGKNSTAFDKGSKNAIRYSKTMAGIIQMLQTSDGWDTNDLLGSLASQMQRFGIEGSQTIAGKEIFGANGRVIIRAEGETEWIDENGEAHAGTPDEVINQINESSARKFQEAVEKYGNKGESSYEDAYTIELDDGEITVQFTEDGVKITGPHGEDLGSNIDSVISDYVEKYGNGRTTQEYLTDWGLDLGLDSTGESIFNALTGKSGEIIGRDISSGIAQGMVDLATGLEGESLKLPVEIELQDNLESIQSKMPEGVKLKVELEVDDSEKEKTEKKTSSKGETPTGEKGGVSTWKNPAKEGTNQNVGLPEPIRYTANAGMSDVGSRQADAILDSIPKGQANAIQEFTTKQRIEQEIIPAESEQPETLTQTIQQEIEPVETPEIQDENADVNYDIGTVEKLPEQSADGTINWSNNYSIPTGLTASGTITWKNNWSKPVASAAGNVGQAHAKSTLMGELGPEMVVSNGRYFVVGQSGPEFVDLAEDAIVFNHLQTRSLLEKGTSSSRGKAITNEQKAVAYARGSIHGGPAHEIPTIVSPPNNGAGLASTILGGIQTGAAAVEEALEAFIKKLDEWYNQLQEIAKIEEKITYQETLRSKIESDLTKNGSAYYKSQVQSILDLNDSIKENQALYLQQQDYLSKRISELNSENSPFSKLYTLDSEGQVKYKDGMKAVFGEKFGATDANKPNYTPQEQYNWLISQGFGDFLKYDSNGKEIDFTDKEGKGNQAAYKTAVESFWKTMEDELTEIQDLKDSIDEHMKAVLEAQQKQNELIQEMQDNQFDLEGKVLNAIVESREREIDEMQKTRDVYAEYSDKMINGLGDALNKEREMYEMQDNQAETDKMRRRLTLLQSSGGSASEIIDLQEQIRQRDRDMYFEEQQRQIDAIKEASDLELERLDAQIELQKELLEYQKAHGLLWTEVYKVMALAPSEITNFIAQNTADFWARSPAGSTQELDKLMFSSDKWANYREEMSNEIETPLKKIMDSILTNDGKKEWENFVAALNQTYGKDFTNDTELFNAYLTKYKETSDPNQAGAAVQAILDARGTKTAAQEAAEAAAAAPTPAPGPTGGGGGGGGRTSKKTPGERIGVLTTGPFNTGSIEGAMQAAGKNTSAPRPTVNEIFTNAPLKKPHLPITKKNKATGNAFAKGTLLGELGPEAWIANGKFHIAGQYGAEMVDLPDDAIVFNHQQTARLLQTGKAGRGNAINGEDAALGNKERNSYISTFWDQVARNRTSMESINYPSYATSSSLERINNELQNNNTNEAITIEHAEVNMNVEQLANDYDAKRAGEQALQEMLRIARKGSVTTVRR